MHFLARRNCAIRRIQFLFWSNSPKLLYCLWSRLRQQLLDVTFDVRRSLHYRSISSHEKFAAEVPARRGSTSRFVHKLPSRARPTTLYIIDTENFAVISAARGGEINDCCSSWELLAAKLRAREEEDFQSFRLVFAEWSKCCVFTPRPASPGRDIDNVHNFPSILLERDGVSRSVYLLNIIERPARRSRAGWCLSTAKHIEHT